MGEVGKSPHVKSRKQALAIAFATQREHEGRAFGGVAPMMGQAYNPVMPNMARTPTNGVAMGMPPTPQTMPAMPMNASSPLSRPLARGGSTSGLGVKPVKMTTGPLVSKVPGRTDLHFTHVPSGSYVIPADIVSGEGQGNTLAGMDSLHKLFKMNETAGSNPMDRMRRSGGFAKGGSTDGHIGKPVPVKLAGGEIVVPPDKVLETMRRISGKKLTLDEAHKALDAWVIKRRKKLRRTLANLPGPVKQDK